MDEPISLDGVRMHVVSTAPAGVVNADTYFTFAQRGSVVSAQYAGGKIELGFLVGVMSGESLQFRYAQLDTAGKLDGGSSTCEVSRTPEGKIRLVEHFQWETREGVGVNVFEEVTESAKTS